MNLPRDDHCSKRTSADLLDHNAQGLPPLGCTSELHFQCESILIQWELFSPQQVVDNWYQWKIIVHKHENEPCLEGPLLLHKEKIVSTLGQRRINSASFHYSDLVHSKQRLLFRTGFWSVPRRKPWSLKNILPDKFL